MEGMRTTITTAALLLLLTACGGGDSDDTPDDAGEVGSGYPACSEVWVEGQTLPENYEGCENGDTIMAATWSECADGTELTTYDDRMWAVGGGPIKAGDSSSEEYAADHAACHGD